MNCLKTFVLAKSDSEMTYIVSGGALNSTHSRVDEIHFSEMAMHVLPLSSTFCAEKIRYIILVISNYCESSSWQHNGFP